MNAQNDKARYKSLIAREIITGWNNTQQEMTRAKSPRAWCDSMRLLESLGLKLSGQAGRLLDTILDS